MQTKRCTSLVRISQHGDDAGFSLVELAVTILVLGLLFAISIPAISKFSGTQLLKGSTENVAAQLRLLREKAIATGEDQTMHFTYNFANADYHVHYPTGHIPAKWKLSKGVTYFWSAGTTSSITMRADGRAAFSGMVILQDRTAARDTVSVQTSGLVLTK